MGKMHVGNFNKQLSLQMAKGIGVGSKADGAAGAQCGDGYACSFLRVVGNFSGSAINIQYFGLSFSK